MGLELGTEPFEGGFFVGRNLKGILSRGARIHSGDKPFDHDLLMTFSFLHRDWREARMAVARACPDRPVVAVAPGTFSDVQVAYMEACRDLRLAEIAGEKGVVEPAQFDIIRLVAMAPAHVQQRMIGRLHAATYEELRTVSTWLRAEGRTVTTADRLGVHPNTVRYRLKRFRMTTGFHMNSLSDLTQVSIALLAFDLNDGPELRARLCQSPQHRPSPSRHARPVLRIGPTPADGPMRAAL